MAFLRIDADAPSVRLHDLIHDGKTQAHALREARLEGLKNLCELALVQPHSRIAKSDANPLTAVFEGHGKHSAPRHGAKGVVAEIPKDLLHTVAVNAGAGLRVRVMALDPVFSGEARLAFEKRQSFLDQRDHSLLGECAGLFSRIVQEVRDDLIEALGFAANDLNQPLV